MKELVALSLRNPVRIAADPKHATPHLLQQECVLLKGTLASKKEAILLSLCTRLFTDSTVIFTRTKQYAHRLKLIFGLASLRASELHGNMSQTQRLQALEDFRAGDAKFLIATDVASRGLDMDDNSRPFLDLLATVEAIDLSARKPSIAAAVTEAVQNFVNQTNDNYQTREPIAPEQSLSIV